MPPCCPLPDTRPDFPASVIISSVSDLNDRIDELACLMQEFGLEKARLKGEDWAVEFAVQPDTPAVATALAPAAPASDQPQTPAPKRKKAPAKPAGPSGTPISSPMTGIFYTASSPGAPLFAKEGEKVTAGQVVGLIEAMKVFNEITATVSGTVTKVVAENGQLVQPGDPLMYIE